MVTLFNILKLLDKAFLHFERLIIIVLLGAMVTMASIQVVLRGLYTHGQFEWANSIIGHIDWSEPFTRLLVLWLTFLGASLITSDNKHIKIDILTELLPLKLRSIRELILSLTCVIICALMLKASIGYIEMERTFGDTVFLNIPAWIGQIILPIGFFLILFHTLIRSFEQMIIILRRSKT